MTMRVKWEYCQTLPSADYDEFGAEGWELCGFTPSGMAVFKRPAGHRPEELTDATNEIQLELDISP